MEDPKRDIKDLIRSLVCQPPLARQADTLHHFFTPDVQFHHVYVNSDRGVDELAATYHIGELVANYQDVDFHKILYDQEENALAVQMTVHTRPWFGLVRNVRLEFFSLLELEDWPQKDGRILKRIKVQHDYFQRSPFIQGLPIIGKIYESQTIRLIIGHLNNIAFDALASIYNLFPQSIRKAIFDLWWNFIVKDWIKNQ